LKPIGPPTAGGENNPEFLDYVSSLHPMKRMAAAQEIAQAALFLLSDQLAYRGSRFSRLARVIRAGVISPSSTS
jgi:NAD(P)-dependent dehydrogenase (short-subunit alcohol dehydrogenase family)